MVGLIFCLKVKAHPYMAALPAEDMGMNFNTCYSGEHIFIAVVYVQLRPHLLYKIALS